MDRYRKLFEYIKPFKVQLTGTIFCAALVSLFTATYAYLLQPVLDKIFVEKDTPESLLEKLWRGASEGCHLASLPYAVSARLPSVAPRPALTTNTTPTPVPS